MLPQTKSDIEIPLGTHYGISGFLMPKVNDKPFFPYIDQIDIGAKEQINICSFLMSIKPRISAKNRLFYVFATAYVIGQNGQILRSFTINRLSSDFYDKGFNPPPCYADSTGWNSNFRPITKDPSRAWWVYNRDMGDIYKSDQSVKDIVIGIRPAAFDGKDANFSITGGALNIQYESDHGTFGQNSGTYRLPQFYLDYYSGARPKIDQMSVELMPSSLNISDDINWDLPAYFVKTIYENSGIKYKFTLTPKPSGDPLIFYGDGHNPPRGTGWKLKSGTLISGARYSGVRHTTKANTLQAGEYEAKFEVVGNLQNGMFVLPAYPMTKDVTLISTRPNVHGLEPNGIDVNIDSPVTVAWTADTQTSFEIKINGHHTIRGGTEKSVVVPVGTFRKGANTIELTARNDTAQHAYTTVTTTFRGYGKPSAPVFDSQTIYNTARPTFTWTCDEQLAFSFTILKGSQIIKSTGEVTTSEKSYTVDTNLQNNTEYAIKLKVKNDKGLWSDEVTKNITISFVGTLKPAALSVFANSRGVVTLNVSNPTNASFDYCEIWRKAKHETKWRRIASKVPREVAINDSLLASNTDYEYKIISYDKQGGSVESESKTAKIEVPEIEFIDLDSMQDINRGYGLEADAPFKTQRVRDKKLLKFEGLAAPVVEIGETDYRVMSFALAFKNYAEYKAFEEAADKATVLLFRSPQGHLIYGQVTDWGDESIDAVGHVTVGFTFTEIAFIQSEIYNAGKTLRVIRLDAGYRLDSGYILDGEYHEN